MDVFVRYAAEIAIFIPDALFAFLPVAGYLRYGWAAVCCAAGVILPSFIAASSYFGAENAWPVIPILVAGAALIFAMLFFLVDISLTKKLFCFFNSMMMGAFCLLYSIAIAVPYEDVNGLWATTRLLSMEAGLAALCLSAITGLAFLRTMCVELPALLREDRVSGMWNFLFLIPLAVLLVICWMTPIHPRIILIGRSRSFVLVLLPLMPLVVLLIYHIIWWVSARFAESAKLQEENTFLQMESKRYDSLRRYMEDTRALRHNFKNHLVVINEYARSGETEKLLEYLSPLVETADGYVSYSGNRAVDAVASHYAERAAAQHTEVEWKIQLPAAIQVKEADYCAILGNLLDNALRAAAALPEERRKITVLSSMLSDAMLGIAVDNPFEGEITFGKNGLPVSAREGHGVGLASVLNTVHRYAGSMNIRTDGGVFSVEILLYPPMGKDGEKENRNRYPHGVFLI